MTMRWLLEGAIHFQLLVETHYPGNNANSSQLNISLQIISSVWYHDQILFFVLYETFRQTQSRILKKASSMQMYDTFRTPPSYEKILHKKTSQASLCDNKKLIFEKSFIDAADKKYYEDPSVIEFHMTD